MRTLSDFLTRPPLPRVAFGMNGTTSRTGVALPAIPDRPPRPLPRPRPRPGVPFEGETSSSYFTGSSVSLDPLGEATVTIGTEDCRSI